MINAQDLRIGNYILDGGGNIVKVTPQRIADIDNKFVINNPIPLTEDILLKCGFERIESKWRLKNGYHWIQVNLYSYFINHIQHGLIEYLHELQNLYFALTKEELEINL